jgi:hypothetical protein
VWSTAATIKQSVPKPSDARQVRDDPYSMITFTKFVQL